MTDQPKEGLRPVTIKEQSAIDEKRCLDVCPAAYCDYSIFSAEPSHPLVSESFESKWGHILEIWEGHATDEEIRYKGSSGGAITAISLYCIEQLGMEGALQIAQDPIQPTRNHTTFSTSRNDLLAATGSRYSPASVCDKLTRISNAESPCVIVGKPAEIAAVRNLERTDDSFAAKLGITISFFCAETPPSKATDEMIKSMGADPEKVIDLRYRGFGWPGHFAPTLEGDTEPCAKRTYQESWAFLQKFRPWSTHIWPDGAGELADISCGDPWYEQPDGQNPGFSLVVARTRKGKEIIDGAIASGYLKLTKAEPWKLEKSQLGLLDKKGSVWGRRLAMRLIGMPVTEFAGMDLFHCWKRLGFNAKLKSTFGTMRRLIQRKLYRPLQLESHQTRPR